MNQKKSKPIKWFSDQGILSWNLGICCELCEHSPHFEKSHVSASRISEALIFISLIELVFATANTCKKVWNIFAGSDQLGDFLT